MPAARRPSQLRRSRKREKRRRALRPNTAVRGSGCGGEHATIPSTMPKAPPRPRPGRPAPGRAVLGVPGLADSEPGGKDEAGSDTLVRRAGLLRMKHATVCSTGTRRRPCPLPAEPRRSVVDVAREVVNRCLGAHRVGHGGEPLARASVRACRSPKKDTLREVVCEQERRTMVTQDGTTRL